RWQPRRVRDAEMREHVFGELRRRAAAIRGPHDGGERFAADPIAASLVADDMAPPTGPRRVEVGVAPVHDGSGAPDDDDARRGLGPGDERDERVIDDQDARLVANPAHDGANDSLIVLAIDPGDAKADRRWRDGAITDGGFHHLVQDLFNGELARRLKVRAGDRKSVV